jgi:hypothetical protein
MTTSKFLALCVLVTLLVQDATAACNDVSFWIEEGKLLYGDLLSPTGTAPPPTDFHNQPYADLPTSQDPAITGCGTDPVTFSLVSPPTHHTPTAVGYTPVVGPFALSANGQFLYANLASLLSRVTWNGFDKFTFNAVCGAQRCAALTAFVNVIWTKAATTNAIPSSFGDGYSTNAFISCNGTCENKTNHGMWLSRHALPRLWDMQQDEFYNNIKPWITLDDGSVKPTDGLDFEWTHNYALITTYGAIGNMAVRFPTFEVIEWKPGQTFNEANVRALAAPLSTGFDQLCLNYQGSTGLASDVWQFNPDQLDGTMVFPGSKYDSQTSWYQKFGGKHRQCDIFTGEEAGVRRPCRYAPLLTPRAVQDETAGYGVWRLLVSGCNLVWQGKFNWNAILNQVLKNGNKAFKVTPCSCTYAITGEIYNQAVQPNSWTDPSRGFVEIDHQYLLKITLAQYVDFQFETGVDTFTVDLQQFRYLVDGQHSFGFNLIVYPKALNAITPQSAPDRRIVGFKWVEHKWIAPNDAQCPGCGDVGLVPSLESGGVPCADSANNFPDYTSALFPPGNCPSGTGVVFLYKGPQTTNGDCANSDPMIIKNAPGISPADPEGGVCKSNYQNITLRGTAVGSTAAVSTTGGFGFEGKITLTFLLANEEHPHFVIMPQLYTKSISITGAFEGTTSTCRGSPFWPVNDATSLPEYICEEPDARTYGPTDWAAIFFDIRDVDPNLVELKKLWVVFGGSLTIKFYPLGDLGTPGTDWTPQYSYLNFRNLKGLSPDLLPLPTHPAGVIPPIKSDFGFAFTPGAHNENTKVTIYCILRVKNKALKHASRRFSAEADTEAENQVEERIQITQQDVNPRSSLGSSSDTVPSSSSDAGDATSTTIIVVLVVACAVLLSAIVGMAMFVVRQHRDRGIVRLASTQ